MTGADLQNHLERYLELRRALGFEMQVEGRLLRDFLAFLQGRTPTEPLMAQAAVEWASSRGGPNWQSKRLSMARCFLVHLRAHLPGIQVPAPGVILYYKDPECQGCSYKPACKVKKARLDS